MKTSKIRLKELGYKESCNYSDVIKYSKIVECDHAISCLIIFFHPETNEFEVGPIFFSSPEFPSGIIDELKKLEVKD